MDFTDKVVLITGAASGMGAATAREFAAADAKIVIVDINEKGALDVAKSRGANIGNAVAFGYCFGGAAVLELARSGADLKGFVTFHGGLKTPEGQNYTKARGQFLILHGTADKAITMDQFADLAKELESAGVAHEMITYSGAPHAFTVFGGKRYQEAADKKSWKRFTEFLSDTLKN